MLNSIEKARFEKMYQYFTNRLDYFAGRCRVWNVAFDQAAARNRSVWGLECRLVADKLASSGNPPEDPVWRTLVRAIKACIDSELPVSNRIARAAWLVGVTVSPRAVATWLIKLRFVVTERPEWVEPVLRTIVNITSWRGSPYRKATPRGC